MLHRASTKNDISKKEYKRAVETLREALLALQRSISCTRKPVIIVIAGNDRSGRHEAINTLSSWMDPRFLSINAYGPANPDESRPFFWRFWRDLPSSGEIAIYLRDWTSVSIVQYLNDDIGKKKLAKRIQYINAFERKQLDHGAALIKFWLHIDEKELKKRVKQNRDTPFFDKKDELALKNYPHAIETIESTLKLTSTGRSQWHIINGANEFERDITIGTILKEKLSSWLDSPPLKTELYGYTSPKSSRPSINMDDIRDSHFDKKKHKKNLAALQSELRALMFCVQKKNIPIVIVFEGWDAAGKGGAIRRLVSPLDAGFYKIKPIAKPSDEEFAHHYLWRFWKHVPQNGRMTIFDRSWYGRVLVERVEKFASELEWKNAYQEINDFEEQLSIHNTIVIKYWLNISKQEQLRRFQERENTEHKKHKITEEDYRNREKWDEYVEAIEEMIQRTHTKNAPWTIINTNNKMLAREGVLENAITQIRNAL